MPFEFIFGAPRPDYRVVIHNDERTVWAYLHSLEEIIADVWLFNLEDAPEEIESDADRDRAPLNPARYCLRDAHPVIRFADDVELDWDYGDDGTLISVELLTAGERLARLTPGSMPGWSRFAALDGPCALRLP